MDFQRVFFASTKTIMNCHAARTTYMYIYIDRKMKLVHILYKNPCISLLLEKERVVSYVKCLDEHINISLKLILIIGCSQISLNKLSISSRLWFDTWKKCAKTKKYAGPKRQILHSRVHAQIASRTRIFRIRQLNQIL